MGHSLKSRNVAAINWCARAHELLSHRGVDFITTSIATLPQKRRYIRRHGDGKLKTVTHLQNDCFGCFFLSNLNGAFFLTTQHKKESKRSGRQTSELGNLSGDVLHPAQSIIAKSCLAFFSLSMIMFQRRVPTQTTWSHRNLSCSCSYLQVTSSWVINAITMQFIAHIFSFSAINTWHEFIKFYNIFKVWEIVC